MFKISVIIPCYNVEAYIDRCLESVMSQTIGLEHLEVIVVNDASTDKTLEKLYQWEQRFPENIMEVKGYLLALRADDLGRPSQQVCRRNAPKNFRQCGCCY